jgi:5-methyltetrahydrofolate--homocysteine methyltransferase
MKIQLKMGKLQRLLQERVVILDGAIGTNLFGKGIAPGESPSVLNIRNQNSVLDLHKAYVKAGSDVILTNTFSANPSNITRRTLKRIIHEGVVLARRAARGRIVFTDIGPLGELIRPYGVKHFEDAVKDYATVCKISTEAGLRAFFVETQISVLEAKAAFIAARQFSDCIFVCFSLQDNGRTIMGESPESIAITFEALGASGVGVSCTTPEVAVEAISKMASVTKLPLVAKPNAGKIQIRDGRVYHTLSDMQLTEYYEKLVRAGANMVGGCCGTTPKYIEAVAKKRIRPSRRKTRKTCYLTAPGRVLEVDGTRTMIVGERLNPSGRKKLKTALQKKDYKVYGEEASIQDQAGADTLDVNAFVPILDEQETLLHAVYEVIKKSSLPLFIDTQDYEAAEAVLRFYPGIGVYNSIPARRRALEKWLPMVRRYGFKTVISLIGDQIPKDSKERMNNVKLALRVAKKVRFPIDDLIFDPLVFPVATEKEQIHSTLTTMSRLHNMGLKTILGVSNVSYGLPDRAHLNSALVTEAVKVGATFLILNPLDETVMRAMNASDALFHDGITSYLEKHRKHRRAPETERDDLIHAIVRGDVESGTALATNLLDAGVTAQELVENHLVKGLEIVGSHYEQGKFFIPDLLKAAEVAQSILSVVKRNMPTQTRRGKIVIATVKGDIHDIGKNLAAMVFESAGYEVIDLGKDVTASLIIDATRKHKPDFIGLSALLTTTMVEMENVITALRRAKLDVKVILGGPNVNAKYAEKIGAFGAARNVFEGLRLLKRQDSATR